MSANYCFSFGSTMSCKCRISFALPCAFIISFYMVQNSSISISRTYFNGISCSRIVFCRKSFVLLTILRNRLRSQHQSIFSAQGHNVYLYGSMIFSLVLSTGIVYMPVISDMFKFQHISFEEYFIAMAMAFSVIPIVEIVKFVQCKMRHQA